MKTLLLTRSEIEGKVDISRFMESMEVVFRAKALGKTQMPPKIYLYFNKYSGDLRVMPSYVEDMDIASVKVVNSHKDNPVKYGLPSVMAVILLVDPKNGFPYAIMDGTWITNMRTGATGGLAAKYLARKNSRIISMIGTGSQARTQLIALMKVFKVEEVRAFSPYFESMKNFVKEMRSKFGVNIAMMKNAEDAIVGSDILVTTTPSREPVVMNEWVSEGMHINAIGADAPGKEELDPLILKRAKIVVDDFEQACHSGEINVPLSKGLLRREDIHAELGQVIAGIKPGRSSDKEVTIFDSTGLAIQDTISAWMVYQEAKKKGFGKEVKII